MRTDVEAMKLLLDVLVAADRLVYEMENSDVSPPYLNDYRNELSTALEKLRNPK